MAAPRPARPFATRDGEREQLGIALRTTKGSRGRITVARARTRPHAQNFGEPIRPNRVARLPPLENPIERALDVLLDVGEQARGHLFASNAGGRLNQLVDGTHDTAPLRTLSAANTASGSNIICGRRAHSG